MHLWVRVLVVQNELGVFELVEDASPDRTPNIKEAIVVGVGAVRTQHGVGVGTHVVVKDRIKPVHVNLIWAVASCRVVRCHMPTVEVGCTLIALARICWHSGVKLADMTCVFEPERWIGFSENLWSVAHDPVVSVEVDRTFVQGKAHLEVNDASSIYVADFKRWLVTNE